MGRCVGASSIIVSKVIMMTFVFLREERRNALPIVCDGCVGQEDSLFFEAVERTVNPKEKENARSEPRPSPRPDGGPWKFGEVGARFPFEEPAASAASG